MNFSLLIEEDSQISRQEVKEPTEKPFQEKRARRRIGKQEVSTEVVSRRCEVVAKKRAMLRETDDEREVTDLRWCSAFPSDTGVVSSSLAKGVESFFSSFVEKGDVIYVGGSAMLENQSTKERLFSSCMVQVDREEDFIFRKVI